MLRELGLSPSKALGQHFLHDRNIVRRIVTESGVDQDDTVLEIGPGLGILTQELASRVRRVIAVERDRRLAERLMSLELDRLEVVVADALEVDYHELMGDAPYHVVANLPYSVGTAIIQRIQESVNPPRSMTLMLQREVAERIVAQPPNMNLLAVGVQFHGTPKLLFRVGSGAFVPPPNVQSAVIRIVSHTELPVSRAESASFFRIVRSGFSQPRKQLLNNLANGLSLPRDRVRELLRRAGIDPTIRPERLPLDSWVRIYQAAVASGLT